MKFWQGLWRVQLAGLISLTAFAIGVGLLFVLDGGILTPSSTPSADIFVLGFLLTLYFGIVPAMLLGAPAYTALSSGDKVQWRPLLVTVVLPGIAMLVMNRAMGLIAIVGGPAVLCLTHLLHQKWSQRAN
ncbi:MAG: hypothetical protein IPG25_17565 [Proteobacteria bacterium]|nr:hypothetical protein [Pseudomonadota bacterium]